MYMCAVYGGLPLSSIEPSLVIFRKKTIQDKLGFSFRSPLAYLLLVDLILANGNHLGPLHMP
jgi:hypothetical protein